MESSDKKMKECTICKVEQEVSCFYQHRRQCKICLLKKRRSEKQEVIEQPINIRIKEVNNDPSEDTILFKTMEKYDAYVEEKIESAIETLGNLTIQNTEANKKIRIDLVEKMRIKDNQIKSLTERIDQMQLQIDTLLNRSI